MTPEVAALLTACPVGLSMGKLVDGALRSLPASPVALAAVSSVSGRPDLQAAIWLLVDDLERAHLVCQDDSSSVGSYWHAVVHRREGDFGNSMYWHRLAGPHPAGFDGVGLVRGVRDGSATVDEQREEWLLLWDWCLANGNKESN